MPPNFPGYSRYCPYERDLAEARRLVEASGTKGASVAVSTRAFSAALAPPVVSVLRALGYRARLDLVSDDAFFPRLGRGDFQAVILGWQTDYPSAASWIEPQFTCASIAEGGPNTTRFCDQAVDREIERAIGLQATDRTSANEVWARVDRMITDRAPIVTLFYTQLPYFVSERVGNYQYHPVWEVLLDQLWVR